MAHPPKTATASRWSLTAPEGQGVTFVELFFDLVFVFALTQVTIMVAHDLTWSGVGHGVLVFWMIWWAWTQFTWALNPADTDHGVIRIGTLFATAVVFIMAISVGTAFEDGGAWFVVPYAIVRILGIGLYLMVGRENAAMVKVVRQFGLLSMLGLACAVAGGFMEPELRVWFWLAAIFLDILAAAIGGGQDGWNLHAPHFAERHGLFVIIALGESLIAAGVGAVNLRTPEMLPVAIGAVLLICLLWWSYFGWLNSALEHSFGKLKGAVQAATARDMYSLLHFPMLLGVIGLAVAIEEMMKHPADPVHTETIIAFGTGLVLFCGSAALSHLRGVKKLLWVRMICLVAIGVALAMVGHPHPTVVLGIGIVGIGTLVLAESRSTRA